MRFFDLFAGIGGFRLGLQSVGFEYAGSCEIDPYCEQIYEKNFGTHYDYHDARRLDPSTMPDFDILSAGFPCQAFSYAGKRMGFADQRGSLFLEIARIAEQKRPSILFLENVRGLLSHDRGRTFGTIIKTLYELGYDVEWQIINGKYFVPQNRERIYIIGHLREKPTRAVFPIRTGEKGSDKTRDQEQGERERFRGPYTRAIDSSYFKGWRGNRTIIMLSHTTCNLRRRIQNKSEVWNLAVTQGVFENKRIRKLTPLECERLMGFPDNWTAGVSDTQRYKMIGNSVIVPLIEFIASKLN